MMTSIFELIAYYARITPAAPALIGCDERRLTYKELIDLVQKTVSSINELGLGREDRVAVVLPAGLPLAAVFLSVACGAACAPLNPAYKLNEFRFFLRD